MTKKPALSSCGCCSATACPAHPGDGITRRDFLVGAGVVAGAAAMGGLALSSLKARAAQESARRSLINLPLRMQPVLLYQIFQHQKATSWRPWGGLHTEAQVTEEKSRIEDELKAMVQRADFPIEMLPLVAVKSRSEADQVAQGKHDGVIIYAASGGGDLIETLAVPDKWNLIFVRHRSGPVYLWYEIAHPIFLRKMLDQFGRPGMDVQDVVVDNPDEVLWRLRALHGLKNTLGKRIVAIGGASGWGPGGAKAPEITRNLWKMEIVNVPYPDLGKYIQQARQNDDLVARCRGEAGKYLAQQGVSLETDRQFVEKAFVLCEVFKDLLDAAETDAITINSCMGTIMPMSETTACLPLSLLNDAGYLAFCESDFVVIPSGIMLHYISSKPVFLNDPTYPHDNLVTLAHCTAPRKMDGANYEDTRILTHFESDYGAAPKVNMRLGAPLTTLAPDFACKRWVGFDGEIVDHPFLDICRSQIDVRIKGGSDRLLEEMQGFHWMCSYGNYLRETGYALRKVGVDFLNLSPAKAPLA
ncbi:MAG: twin-arginine translocation signal domain-containing protein [Candidatus Omnitrophica bacterium]|nr:twin-arginine translocation signal domain-containing protein [Candidatus Omnitrophota bacterium]